jgi:hypothetical protein
MDQSDADRECGRRSGKNADQPRKIISFRTTRVIGLISEASLHAVGCSAGSSQPAF